jgi:hypothetical protein
MITQANSTGQLILAFWQLVENKFLKYGIENADDSNNQNDVSGIVFPLDTWKYVLLIMKYA